MNPKFFHLRLPVFILTSLVFAFFCGGAHADESTQREIVLKKAGHELYSPIVELEKPYNAVILSLSDFTEGLKVNFHPGQGGAWEPVVTRDDGYGSSFLLFSSPSRSIQFLKEPKGNETAFPLKADFLYEGNSSGSDQHLVSGPETNAGFRVIPRSEWGADETMRYWSPDLEEMYQGSDTEADSGATDPCGNFATLYKNETAIDRTVSTSPSGDILVWPLAYAKSVKKIVVHHTDSDIRDLNGDLKTDGQDYEAMMRAIYRFHTFTRGWGDIGYNYVIDPLGNVYEGRYGGDRVIGAHAKCFNNGSLGIAIIGDYQVNKVPEPALNSLINLIALKSRQFGIDPQGSSTFRGKDLFNVLGHRDVRPTSCPGDALYSLLPKIRDRAGFAVRSGTFSDESSAPIQSLDYNAESQSSISTLLLLPNERKTVLLRFKNTGTKTWDSNTWLHVSLNDRESARVVPLISDKTFVAADMKEGSVGPGETGTFEVDFEAGYFGANVSFELAPVINGRYKVSKAAVFVPVQVAAPVFDYSVVKTSLPKGVVFQGQKISASIELQNTGNVAWVNYGPRAIKLGTEGARDRKSLLAKKSPTRLGYLVQSEVKPGETGTFMFDLEAPLKFEGEIREHFTPVIERVGWLPNKDLGFNVIVKKPIHMARIVDKTQISTLVPGEMKKIQVTLENRGDLPWESDTMAIGLLAKELKVFKTEIIPSTPVDPKSTAIFDFWVQAPYKEADGSVFLNSKFRKISIRGGTARFLIHVPAPRLRAQKVSQSSAQVELRPGEEKGLEVQFKNLSNAVWRNSGPNTIYLGTAMPQDRTSALYYQTSWENKSRAGKMVEKEVNPGQTATFLFKVRPQVKGDYHEAFQLVMERVGWVEGALARWDFHVSGDKITGSIDFKKDARDNKTNAAIISKAKSATTSGNTIPAATTTTPVPASEKPFRVKISYTSDQPKVTADQNFQVVGKDGSVLFDVKVGSPVEIRHVNNLFHVQVGTEVKTSSIIRIVPLEGGTVEILTMERRPDWNQSLNDNKFRGILEIREVNGLTAFINELPLEDYISGLAEVSNDTPFEKQKAIAILARTYARYYMSNAHRKFPGLPYDGSDDPVVFQRYLGYGVELRSPNFVSAVQATRGRVVTYNGSLIKTPYFNQSNGKTLSALEVWGWKDTPYLQSVADPYCEGMVQKGHGVGMSGCGAEGMAKAGKKYDEIIKYYFQGVEIEELKI
jgi:hypothetical protein